MLFTSTSRVGHAFFGETDILGLNRNIHAQLYPGLRRFSLSSGFRMGFLAYSRAAELAPVSRYADIRP